MTLIGSKYWVAEAPVSKTVSLVATGGPAAPCVFWEVMAAIQVACCAVFMSWESSLNYENRRGKVRGLRTFGETAGCYLLTSWQLSWGNIPGRKKERTKG